MDELWKEYNLMVEQMGCGTIEEKSIKQAKLILISGQIKALYWVMDSNDE